VIFGAVVLAAAVASASPRHTNRLAHDTSRYLLQHASNPIDWYPWGDEALKTARKQNKPIFLSIGYSTCHWCHVMEAESFSNAEIGALMNAHFVAILVDREERPDAGHLLADRAHRAHGRVHAAGQQREGLLIELGRASRCGDDCPAHTPACRRSQSRCSSVK